MGLMPVWSLPGRPWLGWARAGAASASQQRERMDGIVSAGGEGGGEKGDDDGDGDRGAHGAAAGCSRL